MINKTISGISKLQITMGTVFLIVFFVVVSLQVIFRYVGISAMWTEEIAQYSFIWSAFMGGSAMVDHKQHFAFTSIKDRMKGKGKYFYDIAISLVMLIFVSVMAVIGWIPVMQFWSHRWIGIPLLKMGFVWLCIPITGITCSVYLIRHICFDVIALRKGEDTK